MDGVDDLEGAFLEGLAVSPEEARRLLGEGGGSVDAGVLQSIRDHSMLPEGPCLRGRVTVGYTFFERTTLPDTARQVAADHYDVVVAGSSWCEEILRRHGFTDTATIVQGVDPQLFNPTASEKRLFQDRFVVFSGGKLSLRKGHDLVIRAFKVLQDRHRDVLLVNAWFNPWPETAKNLAASPHIRFEPRGETSSEMVQQALAANGIDLEGVITVPARPNALMAKIYKNTDVGLFPNRCEGGTNLVLMEYMACGKPVIAADSSGHRDIITAENSRRIEALDVVELKGKDGIFAVWDEPNLAETIEHLEWAYQNRDQLLPLGHKAGLDLAQLTWDRASQSFLDLLRGRGRRENQGSL